MSTTCPTCEGSGKINPLEYHDLIFDDKTGIIKRGNLKNQLTPVEFKLLEYFMMNRHIILTHKMIANAVWDNEDLWDYSNTIQVFISTLRKKLGDPSLIHTVRKQGYMFKLKESL